MTMASDPLAATLGPIVDPTPAKTPDSSIPIQGTYVTLEGIRQDHTTSLWRNLNLAQHPELMNYLPWPNPSSAEHFWEQIQDLQSTRKFIIYAMEANPNRLNPSGGSPPSPEEHTETMGMIAYLDVQPANRQLEVGAALFSKPLQKTAAATEAHYLMLKNASEASPPWRRISWKCNRLNKSSRRAAERLGYVYEGTFRNHMISRGRSRDSDWLSIIDEDWPVVKAALEKWLDVENFDAQGRQVRSLNTVRAGIQRA